jgi:hypothetical protein
MLLIVGCARDAGNNSEDGTEPIVHAVDCVGNPTAAASVPAFTFQNGVERGLGIRRSCHHIQRTGVRFFFQRAGPKKSLYILLIRECAIALRRKLALMFFLRRFHPANGDVRSK